MLHRKVPDDGLCKLRRVDVIRAAERLVENVVRERPAEQVDRHPAEPWLHHVMEIKHVTCLHFGAQCECPQLLPDRGRMGIPPHTTPIGSGRHVLRHHTGHGFTRNGWLRWHGRPKREFNLRRLRYAATEIQSHLESEGRGRGLLRHGVHLHAAQAQRTKRSLKSGRVNKGRNSAPKSVTDAGVGIEVHVLRVPDAVVEESEIHAALEVEHSVRLPGQRQEQTDVKRLEDHQRADRAIRSHDGVTREWRRGEAISC